MKIMLKWDRTYIQKMQFTNAAVRNQCAKQKFLWRSAVHNGDFFMIDIAADIVLLIFWNLLNVF